MYFILYVIAKTTCLNLFNIYMPNIYNNTIILLLKLLHLLLLNNNMNKYNKSLITADNQYGTNILDNASLQY